MLHVPARFAANLVAFAPVFVQAGSWQNAQMLLLQPGCCYCRSRCLRWALVGQKVPSPVALY
jgi:hypothetical protein